MTQIRISSCKGMSSTSLGKSDVTHNYESQLINAALPGTSTLKSSQEDSK